MSKNLRILPLIFIILVVSSCRKAKLLSKFEGTYEIIKIDKACCDAVLIDDGIGGYYTAVQSRNDTLIDTIQISMVIDTKRTMLVKSIGIGDFEKEAILRKNELVLDYEIKSSTNKDVLNGSVWMAGDHIFMDYSWVKEDIYNAGHIGAFNSGSVEATGVRID